MRDTRGEVGLSTYSRKHIMTDSKLLSLPRELRDIVYSYYLPERLQLGPAGCESSITFYDDHGLLLASHQLGDEALDAFYRLLPTTTIVATRTVRVPFLTSPEYAHFRRKIVNLAYRAEYRKRNLHHFSLSRMSDRHTNLTLPRILESMPSLRKITCEITWEPGQSPTVLLPRIKSSVLTELRRVTIDQDPPLGWDVECQVRDTTRWKNDWSGLVILRKQ